ncbi:Protein of unknown function [Rhizobiales bacterium GAS113]|nr:Protein of unknown function [Rhizobiales bacterium GAS113]
MAERAHLFLRSDGQALWPRARFDLALLGKFRRDVPLEAEIKERRSLPRHRLYWAVLQAVVDATGKWTSAEIMHEAVKMHLGYFEMVADLNGELRSRPKSTSFGKMDEVEFREYFNAAMLAITTEVLPGMTIEDLLALGNERIRERAA